MDRHWLWFFAGALCAAAGAWLGIALVETVEDYRRWR